LSESKKFYNEFEFDEIKYRFIDLTNLTFGEFIDVDSFLSKTAEERKKEMNLLMAMLYREVDENNKLTEYDSNKIQVRAERFKKLPVKYVNGASSFFLRIEKILQGNIRPSLWSQVRMKMKMGLMLGKLIVSLNIGVGLARLYNWRTRILTKLKK
jgi:hypothetical protein